MDIKKHFLELYKDESDSLFRYVYLRISQRDQAVDIVQDVFMKLWDAAVKHHEKGEKVKNYRALLFAIARNAIIDWYRKKKAISLDALIDDEAEGMQFPDDSYEKIVIEAEGKMLIRKIASLTPSYQQAVYLRFVEDLSPKEIAEVLNMTPNLVSVRIDRGIKELRKMYEE